MKKILLVAVIILVFPLSLCPAFEGRMQERVALQISSAVSDGKYTLAQIVSAARDAGTRIVIFGERDIMRWEYGIWPLRGLLKKTVEERSLLRYGVRRYLEDIRRLQALYPDMLIVPGVESAPYYYWSGSPFSGNLALNGWHRHMMSFGYGYAGDYEGLPVTGAGGKAYDQYHGDQGAKPYQLYADYASEHGALSFWTHPEARNSERIGGVDVDTPAYADMLTRVDGYTGFFVFYEGYNEVGVPEGIWDSILLDYCAGRRKRPVWAAAGLAVDYGGLEDNLRDVTTVVLLNALTREALIRAMGEGRMYALKGKDSPRFTLDQFGISDGTVSASMGETLESSGPLEVTLEGGLPEGAQGPFRITLIRDAKVVRIVEEPGPRFFVSIAGEPPAEGMGYYRAEISAAGVTCITNPVFFKRK